MEGFAWKNAEAVEIYVELATVPRYFSVEPQSSSPGLGAAVERGKQGWRSVTITHADPRLPAVE